MDLGALDICDLFLGDANHENGYYDEINKWKEHIFEYLEVEPIKEIRNIFKVK